MSRSASAALLPQWLVQRDNGMFMSLSADSCRALESQLQVTPSHENALVTVA